jgi:hypothetical protein
VLEVYVERSLHYNHRLFDEWVWFFEHRTERRTFGLTARRSGGDDQPCATDDDGYETVDSSDGDTYAPDQDPADDDVQVIIEDDDTAKEGKDAAKKPKVCVTYIVHQPM